MIGNPFFYEAADAKIGPMVEERNFVNLFGISVLDLLEKHLNNNLWDIPLILTSSPGGGKSSLMRIFSPASFKYILETASYGRDKEALIKKMGNLGAFKEGKPYILGLWIRTGANEYQILEEFDNSKANKSINNSYFLSLLNSRIIIEFIYGICILKGFSISRDLDRIDLNLKDSAKNGTRTVWDRYGSQQCDLFYKNIAELETRICNMIDDPLWNEDKGSNTLYNGLWSIELLSNLEIFIDKKRFSIKPLVMLDDVHELSIGQFRYLMDFIMSRQSGISVWLSMRKHALKIDEIISKRLNRGIKKKRDYNFIDLDEPEERKRNFKKTAIEIASLRVKYAQNNLGGLYEDFENFLADENEEAFLRNFDKSIAEKVKKEIIEKTGKHLKRFQDLIEDISSTDEELHLLCKRYKMLDIFVERELGKTQKNIFTEKISIEKLREYEKKTEIVQAAELFLAKENRLPYYFGLKRLIDLSSYNIDQFLELAGSLFEEIMTAVRLDKEKEAFLSPKKQDKIIRKEAEKFLNDIPSRVNLGDRVLRLVSAIGKMAERETYRNTAPYAPGVTGTAITMYEFNFLQKDAENGKQDAVELYNTIEASIAHNILEPTPHYRCKGKEYLLLNLNRLLCASFKLPLQRGGFREKPLKTLLEWIKPTEAIYSDSNRFLWGKESHE